MGKHKRYIVELQNSKGGTRIIGKVDNFDEFCNVLSKFLEDRHFNSYYQRYWKADRKIICDVGSHVEFFLISRNDKRCEIDYEEFMRGDKK